MVAVPASSTRERLLAAAVEVFVEQGYENARVQDIARAAGLTTGAIYANFRGKSDLLFEAIGSAAGLEVDALIAQTEAREARGLLEQLGGELPRQHDRPALLLDAIAAARRDPELASLLGARFTNRESHLSSLLERAAREGAVADDIDTDVYARFAMMLVAGAMVVRTLDLEPPDQDGWQALIHRLVGILAPQEES
jgi:AcrR family transcriptional regulator